MATACSNEWCSASTGIHEDDQKPMSGLTFGSGELDFNGYWEFPCEACARAFEAEHPRFHPMLAVSQGPHKGEVAMAIYKVKFVDAKGATWVGQIDTWVNPIRDPDSFKTMIEVAMQDIRVTSAVKIISSPK